MPPSGPPLRPCQNAAPLNATVSYIECSVLRMVREDHTSEAPEHSYIDDFGGHKVANSNIEQVQLSSIAFAISPVGPPVFLYALATPRYFRPAENNDNGRWPLVSSSDTNIHPILRISLIGNTEADRCGRHQIVNQARAMRVAEIMTDFRNIQTYIASIRANPSAEEYNEEGYLVLRRCVAEAQVLLSQPFQTQPGGRGDDEQDKMQLQRCG